MNYSKKATGNFLKAVQEVKAKHPAFKYNKYIAQRLQIHESTFTHILNKSRPVPFETLCRFCKVFGYSLDELVFGGKKKD